MVERCNPYEARIIEVLVAARRPLTTVQVSNFAVISYNTTRKYLDALFNKRKIDSKRVGNRIYWVI